MADDRAIKSRKFGNEVSDRDLTDFIKGHDLITISPISTTFVVHKDAVQSIQDIRNIAMSGYTKVLGGKREDKVVVSYTYLRVFYREGHL